MKAEEIKIVNGIFDEYSKKYKFINELLDKKHALMLIDYLYTSNDNLKELISNYKMLKIL